MLYTVPNRRNSITAKKNHIITTNIKFRKPQNSHRSKHPASHFCNTIRKNVDTIAAILGHHHIIYIECDDKARAPIGGTLANKQISLLGGMSYVRLSDHDFPYGECHCFIISVYVVYVIKIDGHLNDYRRISWSGPGITFIRSGYHEKQSAFNHATDVARILNVAQFDDYTKNEDGIKTMLIIGSDGGHDEAVKNDKFQTG